MIKRSRSWAAILVTSGLLASAETTETAPPSQIFMQEMNAAMAKMDREISAAPMNANIDHDFVTMMLPHHQGAIDMAKSELSYGSDPIMRRLAQEIIVDQQSEIDAMKLWLAKHGGEQRQK